MTGKETYDDRIHEDREEQCAPRFTLGTFGIGGGTSWQDTTRDDNELIEMIRQAYDLGVWGLDTAPVYGTRRSERIIARAIKGRREKYFIATKCALNWRSSEGAFTYERDGRQVYNNFTKAALIRDAEESLDRLDTEYIDLLIIHRTPPLDRFGEVMEAMEELKNRQLIRAVGLANMVRTGHPIEALDVCRKYGALDLVQEVESLLTRTCMQELIQYCESHAITYQAHSSLEKGILTGKILSEAATWTGDNRSQYKWFQPENIPKVNAMLEGVRRIAERYGCSTAALCLAWVRAQSKSLNLLVGARKLHHLEDSLKCMELTLDPVDIEKMSRLSDIANQ